MATNVDEFSAQLRIDSQGANERFGVFVRAVAAHALRGVVLKSPVLTGRLQNNWQVGVERVPSGVVDREGQDTSQTVAEGLGVIDDAPPFSRVHIANNLPYAEAIESGTSRKAPNGMVGVTLEELRTLRFLG